MIVSTSLIRRRDDVTAEEFTRHWIDPHGPLTARLPGVLRYHQNHVLDTPGTNAAARRLRIDGFPILAFESPEARKAAHASPELAACDRDSPLFIGAVARVISDDGDVVGPGSAALVKQIVVAVGDGEDGPAIDRAGLRAILADLDGVAAVIHHDILQQGGAPGSVVPFIGIEVTALAEIWVDPVSVPANARRLTAEVPDLATFSVRALRFV